MLTIQQAKHTRLDANTRYIVACDETVLFGRHASAAIAGNFNT